jgi:hypothetical protein
MQSSTLAIVSSGAGFDSRRLDKQLLHRFRAEFLRNTSAIEMTCPAMPKRRAISGRLGGGKRWAGRRVISRRPTRETSSATRSSAGTSSSGATGSSATTTRSSIRSANLARAGGDRPPARDLRLEGPGTARRRGTPDTHRVSPRKCRGSKPAVQPQRTIEQRAALADPESLDLVPDAGARFLLCFGGFRTRRRIW